MTQTPDPTEQVLRDLIHQNTPMIYTEDEEKLTSEIMKIVREKEADEPTKNLIDKLLKENKEKDERIKELQALKDSWLEHDCGKREEKIQELLSHQKGVDGLVDIVRKLCDPGNYSGEQWERLVQEAKKNLTHYQSLNGGKT